MDGLQSFRLAERTANAVADLANFAVSLQYDALSAAVRERLALVLTDLIGVTVAGARTPEFRTLLASWDCPPGEVAVPGTNTRTTAEAASYLSAVASSMLELDEGNKFAGGHPAAHVVFAALAAARTSAIPLTGRRLLTAVTAGYEVAARFGRATRRDPRWHTHGHWGATGAACAAALLRREPDATIVAAAIDAATGLMHVTPWQTVLSGDFTRNLWAAGANQAGLNAARLAHAGLVDNRGSAAHALSLVGSLDVDALTEDLGVRWLIAEGYLKQHASCSYTHVAVDLIQTLHQSGAWSDPEEIRAVRIRIHSLAEPLLQRHPTSRLSAMFSLPFVAATAVVSGRVDPDVMTPGTEAFAAAEAFSDRIAVTIDRGLDEHLPALRCSEIEIDLFDGTTIGLAQSNPIGDGAHFPAGPEEVAAKLGRLIGSDMAAQVTETIGGLFADGEVSVVLDGLP